MMHKNHVKTNIGAGILTGTTISTLSGVYLIVIIPLIFASSIGAYLGQIICADLDINTSTPSRRGGGELIALFATCIAISEIGIDVSNYTVIQVLLLIYYLIIIYFKNKNKLSKKSLSVISKITAIFCLLEVFIALKFSLMITSGILFLLFATILNLSTSHRKATHNIFIIALPTAAFYLLNFQIYEGLLSIIYLSFVAGYVFGYINHLLMDSFGKRGVPWLYPLSKKEFSIIKVYSADTKAEHIFANAILFIYILLAAVIYFL